MSEEKTTEAGKTGQGSNSELNLLLVAVEEQVVDVIECLVLENMRIPSFTRERITKLYKKYHEYMEKRIIIAKKRRLT